MLGSGKMDISLYIHIPFCVKKCDYCDFLSGPAGKERQREYFQALGREIAAVPDFSDREITTVFIGGGTPSVPDPSLVGEMLDQIRNKFFVAPDAEITIEANPGTLYKEKLQIYLLMSEHWYVYIIIAAVAELLFWVCGKFRIIKSKPLRAITAIFIASLICWVIYDLVTAPN